MYYKSLACILLSFCFVTTAFAKEDIDNGAELLKNCTAAETILDEKDSDKQTPEQIVRGMRCATFIEGFLDGYAIGLMSSHVKHGYCEPNTSNTEQIIRITVKYLKNNPNALQYRDSIALFRALENAFPCDPSKNHEAIKMLQEEEQKQPQGN